MRSDGYQVLVRDRQRQLKVIKEAQETGWDLGEVSKERIQKPSRTRPKNEAEVLTSSCRPSSEHLPTARLALPGVAR